MEEAQAMRASVSSLRTPVKRVSNADLRNMPGGKAVVEAREAADNARRKARQAILRGADMKRRADAAAASASSPAPREQTSSDARMETAAATVSVRQPPTPSTILKANVRRQQELKHRRQEQVGKASAMATTTTSRMKQKQQHQQRKHAGVRHEHALGGAYKPEGKLKLTDLCDEDKSKVVHLLAQAVHTAEARKSAAEAKGREKEWASTIEKLRQQNKDTIEENAALKSKLSNAFSLLKVYQRKIRSLLELNQKMHMDHNVAIVKLHKRYEDLEERLSENKDGAQPAAQDDALATASRGVANATTVSARSATGDTAAEDGCANTAMPMPTPAAQSAPAKPTRVDAATETAPCDVRTEEEQDLQQEVEVEEDEEERASRSARPTEVAEGARAASRDEEEAEDGLRETRSATEGIEPVLRFNPDIGKDGLFYYSPAAGKIGAGASAGAASLFGASPATTEAATAAEEDAFAANARFSHDTENFVTKVPTGWDSLRRDALDARVFDKSLIDIVERVEERVGGSDSAFLFGEDALAGTDEPSLGDLDTVELLRDVAQLPDVSDFFTSASTAHQRHEEDRQAPETQPSSARHVPADDAATTSGTTTSNSHHDDNRYDDTMLTALLNGRSFDVALGDTFV